MALALDQLNPHHDSAGYAGERQEGDNKATALKPECYGSRTNEQRLVLKRLSVAGFEVIGDTHQSGHTAAAGNHCRDSKDPRSCTK